MHHRGLLEELTKLGKKERAILVDEILERGYRERIEPGTAFQAQVLAKLDQLLATGVEVARMPAAPVLAANSEDLATVDDAMAVLAGIKRPAIDG